jgi:uncharacterized protein (DUF58 family)
LNNDIVRGPLRKNRVLITHDVSTITRYVMELRGRIKTGLGRLLGRSAAHAAVTTALCREGRYYLIAVAVAFTAAMLRQVNLLLMLVGMLAGPMVFNWRLVAATLRGLVVRRKMPRGVCAGDLLVVSLELENTRPRLGSWAVVVEDQICRQGASAGQEPLRPGLLFSYLPAGQVRSKVYRGRLVERGRYRVGPLQVSTRFPFGLIRRTIELGEQETLLVYPRLGRLTRAWNTRHHESFEGGHRRERRHSRVSGDFYGVREWRQGDSRRAIHWRSSARHDKLVARQYEQPRNRDVALLVDLWQSGNPTAAEQENVELAVSFAATVVTDLCRKGGSDLLLGVTAASPVCLAGPASAALLQDALETLAVAAAAEEDRLPQLLDQTLQQVEAGADVVLVSTRDVDLSDRRRFASLWHDRAKRAFLRRIRVFNTGSAQLAEVFVAE